MKEKRRAKFEKHWPKLVEVAKISDEEERNAKMAEMKE